MKNGFLFTFKLRSVICLSVFWIMMLLAVVRLTSVALSPSNSAYANKGFSISLNTGRGDFYYSDKSSITSLVNTTVAVFLPTKSGKSAFKKVAGGEELKAGLKLLRNNKPVSLKINQKITAPGVYCFETAERYGDLKGLCHTLGYINGESRGVLGLEKGLDSYLYSNNANTVSFSTDALGNFLAGISPVMSGGVSGSDVYLTVDRDIQNILYKALEKIEKGSALAVEIGSGKIRGMVSKPYYDPNSPEKYVESENSPFLNRNLSAYSVGSVFKPLVAAVMLESSKAGYRYNCTGSANIGGRLFNCNKLAGHGDLGLKGGLVNSCNTYFYTGAGDLSVSRLLSTANALGFGVPIDIGGGLVSDKGSISKEGNLKYSKAAMANFAIGQGDISLSPLAITNLYCAIANGGSYFSPNIVEGIKTGKKYEKMYKSEKNIVFNKSTADTLKEYLAEVVASGTGKAAFSEKVRVAGKTATAQTGRFSGEKEILNAWFCGFFPADNPVYAVTIFLEDATSGGSDCGPIFKEIAEKITSLNKN